MDSERIPSSSCKRSPDKASSSKNEFKKLKEKHEALQEQQEKVTTLDYYWRKSKELESKSNAFEVLLDLKNKEVTHLRQELDTKSEEPPPDKEETTALKNQLEDLFQKGWDLQVKCLQHEKTIEDLTSDVATLTSASKEKDEVISKLDKESGEVQESLKNLSMEFARKKQENQGHHLLVVQAADQIINRDNLIEKLHEKNCQLEGKLQSVSEEQSALGKIIEGFRAKCGVDVGRGVSAVQLLALLTDFDSNQFTTLDQFRVQLQGWILAGQEAPLPPTVDLYSTLSPPELDMDTRRKRGCSKNKEEVPRKVVKSEVARGTGMIAGLDSCKPPVVKLDCSDSEEDFVVNIKS